MDHLSLFSGAWSLSGFYTSLPRLYGSNYSYAVCSASATATVVYRPIIVVPGYYDVSIWYPGYSLYGTFSARAPWTVVCDSGSFTTNINEQSGGGAWRPIATCMLFSAGTNDYVALSNATGESSRVVAADAVCLLPSQCPAVLTNPVSQTAKTGTQVTFKIGVGGSPPFSYQWVFNGTNLLAATGSSLTISGVQPSHAGSYSALVSNAVGTVATPMRCLQFFLQLNPC